MISKIRYFVDEACLLKMFYSFVQSHINYNILNWSCTLKTNLAPIENKLKKAIRVISFAQTMYDHTDPLFKQHNILHFLSINMYHSGKLYLCGNWLMDINLRWYLISLLEIYITKLNSSFHTRETKVQNLTLSIHASKNGMLYLTH